MTYNARDASGALVPFQTTVIGGQNIGASIATDPTTGVGAAVANHTADNQNLGSGAYGMLVGAIIKVRNAAGLYFDVLRNTGSDLMSAKGVPAFGHSVAQEFLATTSSSVAATTVVAGPLGMTNTTGFVVGGTVNFEPGTANYEPAEITAVVANTSISVQFPAGGALFTHTASYTLQTFGLNQARQAPGGTGVTLVSSDGTKATYRYSVTGITPVATPTDVLVIQGSATKTGRIKYIKVGGKAGTGGQLTVQIIRRSTAGTLGSATLTAITAFQHDGNDAPATLTVSYVQTANYTTLGTAAGGHGGVKRMYLNVPATGPNTDAIWTFGDVVKAIELRGLNDFICLNFNGDTVPASGVVDFELVIEEDGS
jgi:hypothetical protein